MFVIVKHVTIVSEFVCYAVYVRVKCDQKQFYCCPPDVNAISLSLASVKSRLDLPFWYLLTQVVQEKGPLNVCVCLCICVCMI